MAQSRQTREENPKKLRHGQALSMQWVSYLIGMIYEDTLQGGSSTKALLKGARSVGGGFPIKAWNLACLNALNVFLPFTMELALKSLLTERKRSHDLLALYKALPINTQNKIEDEFQKLKQENGFREGQLITLLESHRQDFERWRYLDDKDLKGLVHSEDDWKEMHYGVCAILNVYNSSNLARRSGYAFG